MLYPLDVLNTAEKYTLTDLCWQTVGNKRS